MNRLPRQKRTQLLQLLLEGMSMRAVARSTDVAFNTVKKLLLEAGRASATYHDRNIRGVKARHVQCDEIWSYVYAKQKNVDTAKGALDWVGDIWTWTALDVDTKLLVSYLVGDRAADSARTFMRDLASRVDARRIELTTDAYGAYPGAVEEAFSGHVDYGTTEMEGVSNSYVERQNLTMRMSMRRFTRKTNAFSKKAENHIHMVALYALHYNFCRIHQTIRCTPAMEAGLTKDLHDIEWLVDVIEKYD